MINHQSGFSAVELMISLFIAVAFIATGYQLYSVIIKEGASARQRAQASTIVYSHLRRLSAQPSGNCNSSYPLTPVLTAAESASLPQSAVLSAQPYCPYGTTSNVWRITVTIKYGTPIQEVSHALFVTR